jgi:glycosyltransferase involved in cell wall biosynthesis
MISVAIFTLNEETNLPHCLKSLQPHCQDIVVVDSFSTDQTCEIAKQAGARVFQHAFTGFGDQRMWALQNIDFRNRWILILDADEQVTPQLWEEMVRRVQSCAQTTSAFRLKRRFYWNGVWLKHANLYPSWIVRLIRRGEVTYLNRGHAETQHVEGALESLEEDLIDQNHKGLKAWRERQQKYAQDEARYEVASQPPLAFADLRSADPLQRRSALKALGRRLPFRGLFYFIYAYVIRRGWKDGSAGFQFCLEKARFQSQIARTVRKLRREQQS